MRKLLIGAGVASMLVIAVLAGAVLVFAQHSTATDASAPNDTPNEGMTEANESAAPAGLALGTDNDNIQHEFDGEEEHED